MIKFALLAILLLLWVVGCGSVGEGFCELKHPIENWTTSYRKTCEKQHVLQRQRGGGDDLNIVYINTVEHDYLDRSKDKPWDVSDDKWLQYWGDDNLRQAYKLGTYATGFHFQLYHYKDGTGIRSILGGIFSGDTTLMQWDGVSHILYGVGSVFNFITKEASYIGYQFERLMKGRQTQFVDAVLGVLFDLIEVLIGIFYSLLGVVVGTILNPLDTFTNLLGGVVLTVQTMVVGVWNTIADIIGLFTLGSVQLQTACVFPEWGADDAKAFRCVLP